MAEQSLFDFGEEKLPYRFTLLDQIIRDKKALLEPDLSDEDFEFISARVEEYLADYRAGCR